MAHGFWTLDLEYSSRPIRFKIRTTLLKDSCTWILNISDGYDWYPSNLKISPKFIGPPRTQNCCVKIFTRIIPSLQLLTVKYTCHLLYIYSNLNLSLPTNYQTKIKTEREISPLILAASCHESTSPIRYCRHLLSIPFTAGLLCCRRNHNHLRRWYPKQFHLRHNSCSRGFTMCRYLHGWPSVDQPMQ